MATTYMPIQSVTLSTSAASVTFSSIPQTYTDLVLRVSSRASNTQTTGNIYIQANSITSGYSGRELWAYGSTTRCQAIGYSAAFNPYGESNGATANTFGSLECYFPNYLVAAYKTANITYAIEDNSSAGNLVGVSAQLLSNNAAISTLTVSTDWPLFLAGSTFHLYGIKNS